MKNPAAALLTALAASALLPGATAYSSEKPEKPTQDGQYVAVSTVALPVITSGVVQNYIFVTVRIDLTASANAQKMREKEPYFRDALVRAGHRTPFNKAGDPNHVDEAQIIASLSREAQAICGPGVVQAVRIVSQTPKSWVKPPPR